MQVSWSYAEEDDSDNADITFRNYMKKGSGGTYNWSDTQRPYFNPADASLIDPNEMEFDAFEMWENVSEDTEVAFQINAEKLFESRTLKTGVKYKSREKKVDDYIIAYEWDKVMSDFDMVTGNDIGWFLLTQVFAHMLQKMQLMECVT